ncbi:hypothetical protein RhiirA4_484364 [Rhizophagus irregularis]|uniref:Uncharacterized protein n=1 Tax=Rhizophagus irregularis TaxID=588596 RepID=A0A2I1HNT4_9GLOM|nr:hypothetical protein RhiirA4_484364 [Rhizophagus irregularis]
MFGVLQPSLIENIRDMASKFYRLSPEMLEEVEFLVNIGCSTGPIIRGLQKRFPDARIYPKNLQHEEHGWFVEARLEGEDNHLTELFWMRPSQIDLWQRFHDVAIYDNTSQINKVMIRFGEPERHKQQSYAERAIQAIQEPLLKRMVAQELKTGVTSVEWSEDFHNVVSKQPPTYLLNGPHRRLGVSRCAYTQKELQVVPENERPPPDSVIRGQPERFVPKQILRPLASHQERPRPVLG